MCWEGRLWEIRRTGDSVCPGIHPPPSFLPGRIHQAESHSTDHEEQDQKRSGGHYDPDPVHDGLDWRREALIAQRKVAVLIFILGSLLEQFLVAHPSDGALYGLLRGVTGAVPQAGRDLGDVRAHVLQEMKVGARVRQYVAGVLFG